MPKGIIGIPAGKGYITCSMIGDMEHCGYGTMLGVYERYMGTEKRDFTEEQLKSMDFGTNFEEAVAQYFCHLTGLKVTRCGNNAWWRKDMPYFICHPDRLGRGLDKKGRRFAVEIKCVSPSAHGWGEEGSEEIPDNYYLQCQGYFACGVPCDVVYVACMKGNRVYIYEILPDSDVIAYIIRRVRETKESFDMGIVPDPENYGEALSQLIGKVDYSKEGMPAGDTGRELWEQLLANHKLLNEATEREEELKRQMVTLMGDAPAVITSDEKGKIKVLAKLTETHRKVFDKEAFKAKYGDLYQAFEKEQVSYSVRFAWPREKKED